MDLNFAIAQINLTVGDFKGNYQKICQQWDDLESKGADIILMPELTICGYDPRDLAQREEFCYKNHETLQQLITQSRSRTSAIIVGAVTNNNGIVYNSAFVIHNGTIIHHQNKCSLPNYGVFDEQRLYTKGDRLKCFKFKNRKLALLICEDAWDIQNYHKLSRQNPEAILILNASPFEIGKYNQRIQVVKKGYNICRVPAIYCNLVGAQDSIVFDGASFAINADGKICCQLKRFEEDSSILNFSKHLNAQPFKPVLEEEIYSCLMLALKDYLYKNSLTQVVLGLSGGIDSALTAAIAIDAIGAENVHLITLPSRFNSKETFKDSEELCKLMRVEAEEISIEPIFTQTLASLANNFTSQLSDVTEENLQSRIRGLLLMAISNKYGYMLLSTGNKSEIAVGYATLYGDMNGGYNLLKDVYKTQIFMLARWRNNNLPTNALGNKGKIIPDNIITKAPSAELSHNQKDTDSLPNYDMLDAILYRYIELGLGKEQIISDGFNPETVDKVLKLIKIGEFKRNQSTLGPKISTMSFDLDWRYPITNKFIN